MQGEGEGEEGREALGRWNGGERGLGRSTDGGDSASPDSSSSSPSLPLALWRID